MHHYGNCVGVSGVAFQTFLCFGFCSHGETVQLNSRVQQLKKGIRGLKAAINLAMVLAHSQQPLQQATIQEPAQRSYAAVVGPSGELDSTAILKQKKKEPNSDKKAIVSFTVLRYVLRRWLGQRG